MAVFRIWSRIHAVDDAHFLTVVAAVPEQVPPDARIESESRVHATKNEAVGACAEMVFAWVRRLEREGYEVAAVESV